MREQGFQYVPADYITVRRGMSADKRIPGLSEEEFIEQHGFGITTFYTGEAPQLTTGYSPARVGLGEQNVQIFQNLSAADRVAYNRALFGEDTEASFANGLELENFARCGGCTRKAIEQVFEPQELEATFYNPLDAKVNEDPRMRAAFRKFSEKMREEGYAYGDPEEVEEDLWKRLDAVTESRTLKLADMSPERRKALEDLQNYERRVAALAFELTEEILEPVEERILKEMVAREVK